MGWGRKGFFLGAVVGIALLQNMVWGDKDTASIHSNRSHRSRRQSGPHPLDPLTSLEISQTSTAIKNDRPGVQWVFIWITLREPPKALLLPYFLSDTEPPADSIPRRALAVVLNPVSGVTFEGVVNLRTSVVEAWTELPGDVDSSFAADELTAISEMVLEDPGVLERLAVYGEFYGNKSNVVTDVWKYGYKDDKPEYAGKRIAQVFFFGRNFDNDNFYAHPMGFAAVVDILRQEVLEIEEIPIHEEFDSTNREGDEVPEETGNYDPTVSGRWYRDDISPITITQENGPSFSIDGNVLKWQKFKMRIGRNGREGLVLHNVNYNDTSSGTIRPLLYRASLSELFVPYGDPRPPYHRKMALDVGEYGMGFSASEIRAPDGCRGSVYFLDTINNDMAGEPWTIKNAICIYEEDAGILWRKMDPVTRRIVTARSQRLVLTFIATVSNYDYQLKWAFYQDASIRLEMVLTGIVSQNLLGTDATPGGHGTITSPHINSQFHQHFFAVRLDTEIDGNRNTVSTVDILPDDIPAGDPTHPYGNGFSVNETVLQTASEGRTKTQPDTARTWRVIGEPTNLNPISGGPKGWKLIPDHVARLMMSKESILHPKNAFVDYDVWVTPYKEDQLYAAGTYLNQSGLPKWVEEAPGANIVNEDIVLWHVFGVTHVVRVEDLPVMNTETVGFWFKPTNFFTENPGIDVLPTVHESESSRRGRG